MSFVSYAQNAEDVMLWRALGHVRDGFYIDVGAQEPELDSVTLAFYERGWRGVNIEPVPAFAAALRAARPRDVTLDIAISDAPGRRDFFLIGGTGLSTLESDVAALQGGRGWKVERTEVEVSTLAAICHRYAPADIHFLKIDVEGGELAVLRGADLEAFRPWIVLVEATRPNSQEENWQEWEPLLLAARYRFVWFDGLNRFYLAAERHAELAPHFRAPPNVYDHYVRNDPEARQRQRAALADIEALRARNAAAERQIGELRAEIARLWRAQPAAAAQTRQKESAEAPDVGRLPRRRAPWRLRRLLRPLAAQARDFFAAETRSELTQLRAAADATAQTLREMRDLQAALAADMKALREHGIAVPEAISDLARAAEVALLSLARDQSSPSASNSRST
jgi:FkbM family methyltransferase